jgi:hypothetical protein
LNVRSLRSPRWRGLALIDLIQDIDVLLPLLIALRKDGRFSLNIVVSMWLSRESPRTELLLRRHGLRFSGVARRRIVAGQEPRLSETDFLLTACDSSHPAHAAGHALARRARASGVATFTVQHGLENPGLAGPFADAQIASEVMFRWGGADGVTDRVELVPVGRPWIMPEPRAARYEVGVFENLHDERYSEADRAAFKNALACLAATGQPLLLRPHPAGRWGGTLADLARSHPNLVVQDTAMLATSAGGAAVSIAECRRVITTPSTVAVDAAMAGKPLALALPGGPYYEPLPTLADEASWVAFATSSPDGSAAGAFLQRHVLPGDAATRICGEVAKRLIRKGLVQRRRMW